MSTIGISQRAARHVIERMGETGQPPERHALAVNVGTDEYLDVLRAEYLVPIKEQARGSSFKLVQATFGGGKTQFLHCLREVAWDLGFATALVGLSPKECPFDDPVKIYAEVARRLELPPTGPDEAPEAGVEVVLRHVIEQRVEHHGAPAVREWIATELSRAPVESRGFRKAACLYLDAVVAGEDDREELLASYLRGESVSPGELEPLRVREAIDANNAFRCLRSVVQILRALGTPGCVFLFDEMDRVMSLSKSRKRAMGDNLRQMIDYCGQSFLPSLLWVYAVPPEFMTEVVPEYAALAQRLKGISRLSVRSPLEPLIDLENLGIGMTQLLQRIGARMLELFERGFDHRFDADVQRQNLEGLASELGDLQLTSGVRRQFVKAYVHLLTQQHREGEKLLTGSEVRALASRGGEVPAPMDEEIAL